MKIGILAYRQMPYISANTAIAYIIGEQLSKRNEITYIGRKQDASQDSISSYKGNSIKYLNKNPSDRLTRVRDYLIRIGLIRLAFYKDVIEMERIIKKESIEALICLIAPNEDAFISMSAKLQIPVFLYQLDPFYNLHDVESPRLKRLFIGYLKKAEHVFTTELLMNQYNCDREIHQYLNKITVVQFPKLIKPQLYKKEASEKTVLLYSGSLYADRKPEFLIELVKCLTDDCMVVFCGKCETKEDEQRLIDNSVLCRGYCTQSELEQEMAKANIFINIGNSVRNQLPSKIIDYISTGKPIINLYQIGECSSKKVLGSYKYHLNLEVNAISKSKELLHEFILKLKNKVIPWDEIQAQYKEYTPAYVAGVIQQQIENVAFRGDD